MTINDQTTTTNGQTMRNKITHFSGTDSSGSILAEGTGGTGSDNQHSIEGAKRSRDAAINRANTAFKQAKAATYFQAQSCAYPTEERERQKVRNAERKKAGILAKTRKIPVEDHYDDCGTDLTGLGDDIAIYA